MGFLPACECISRLFLGGEVLAHASKTWPDIFVLTPRVFFPPPRGKENLNKWSFEDVFRSCLEKYGQNKYHIEPTSPRTEDRTGKEET